MRRLKLFFACLLMAVLSIGQVWAASPATLSFSAACGGSGTDSDGNSWTISSDGTESSFDNTKGIHYGTSSAQVQYIRLSTSGISGTITQVVVNASTASGVTATAAVKVGTTDFTCNSSTTASLSTSATDYTFTGSASGDILVEITKPSKAAKAIYCKSIVVTYTSGGVVDVASVSLNESSITLTIDGVEQQTLTATVLPENATNKNVTWESNNEDVATVVNGVVTAKGAGDATIKCKSVADATKYAECAVHVNPSIYSKSNLIFTAACGGTGTADDDAEWTVTSDGAESVYDATSGIHYGTGSANVTYLQLATSDITGEVAKVVVNARDAQATATISVTVGGTAFTCASATATNTSADYVFTGTGSGEIVVRVDRGSSMSKAIYVKSVVVSYTPAAVEVKKPTFSVEAGSYLEAQSIELNCTTTGADIYYTLNGDDPDENSTHYEGAIPVSTTTTIKAIAILGTTSSPIATATYTIINTSHAGTAEDPYSVADAKIVIDGIGTKEDAYVLGIISQVDSYDGTHKSITYWISADGTTSGQQLQVYSGKGLSGADFSSVDDVVAKATVVVKGKLKKYNDTYEFDYNNELVSYEAPVEPVVALKQAGSTVTVLNLAATSVANQAIDVECTNFADAISSVSAKLYEESTCETEITSGAWVTDITVNGAKDQVTFNVADNAGEARQVWMKVTASDGTNSAFAVLAISQAKYTVDYAELPFAFDGGRADIATTNGMSQEGLDSDYGSSPKLKFNGTDDVVIIKINAVPGTLTYDIKGNSFSDGTFKVQQSADGVDYSDVASYTELNTKSESITLEQTTRYIKFIYTEKVNGNVALGNIGITAYVAPVVTPTVAADPDEVEVDAAAHASQSLGLTYENWGTVNVDEVEATLWNDAACTESFDGGWINNVAVATGNASVSFDIAANTGAARAAYMKIYALGDDGDTDAQTIVSISQAAYVAPFDGLELTFPDYNDASVSSYTASWTATKSGQVWDIYGFNNNSNAWSVIKAGRKSASGNVAQPVDATIVTQVTDHAVGDIVVTVDAVTADQVTSHKLYVADNSEFTNAIEIDGDPATIAAGDITYTVPVANRANDLYYKLEYATAGTAGSNGILTISKITYAYATATPQKQSTGLAYADELKNHLVKVGASYEAPELTNPNTLDGITYASNADAVVEVNETTGVLTIKAAGKAVITASRAEDDTYKAGSASYTIYVATEAGTAADPLSEASAKTLIDLGCTMEAHVHGVVQGEQDATKFTVTLAGGMQFYKLKDLGNVAFESAYIGNGDEVTAVGSLLKYNNSIYELAEGCYLTAYTEYTEPVVTLKQSGSTVTVLNLAATSVANQAIDVECTNFADAISSVSAKLYEESTCETEITSGAWVTDITVNGAKDQVTFNVADNDGDARQVWLKVTASDGTDEAFAVLPISQAKYVPDYATLPFEFDGGRADIANTGGMTQSGLGSDYTGSGVTTKLKFDNTGDNLIIHINEAPDRLSYDIKGNSFSGGTFKVQESEDGETYSDLATYTEDGTSVEHQLASTTRYIKFVYVEKSSGNIGLGNITISKYVAPEPPTPATPDYSRNVTVGNYGTICLPNGGTIEGAELFDIEYIDGSLLYLLAVNGNAMVAGRPYIFLPSVATIEVTYTDDANASAGSFNGLVGSYTKEVVAIGTGDEANYILLNNAYYLVNSTAYVGENRAYIHMASVPTTPSQQSGAPRRRVAMTVNGANATTDLDLLNASEAPVKMIINGQLFILRGEKMFNANGQLVK